MTNESIQKRVTETAQYVLSTGATVRAAAKHFGISKSTVHKDLSCRLRQFSPSMHRSVLEILEKNRLERHIRGGMATKRKYEKAKPTRKNKKC